jgi:hypothetical protein
MNVQRCHPSSAGARRFAYAPTYLLRGVTAPHLEYTPIS